MIYRIVKVEEENLYVKVAEKIKDLTDLKEIPIGEKVFGRLLGYRYGFEEDDCFTAGDFESLYKDAEGNIYFELPEELIKNVFTWLDEEEKYDYRVPEEIFHRVIVMK